MEDADVADGSGYLLDNQQAEAGTRRHLDNIAAGLLDLTTSPMISAWGRKPA